jgi:Holliday junction DNA helicase RuvA
VIHHLAGRLTEKPPGRAVVEVDGVGYDVLVSDFTWSTLGAPGERVFLLTHLTVREDGWLLFGFAAEEERALFRLLLGVQGVGPRLALAVLSGLSVSELRRAVTAGDLAALTAISGVGRKTAQRVLLDLKDKIAAPPTDAEIARLTGPGVRDEAVDALVSLGYPVATAREAVRAARSAEEEAPLEAIIKEALRRL